MERIDRILNNQCFKEHLERNITAEADRRFCRHDMEHFLDVARIGRIINVEEDLGIAADWIYAAGLLHDIGRHIQYEDKTPHEQASALIAPGILKECGFSEEETKAITEAILLHRTKAAAKRGDLAGVLYRADKASRACFACPVEKECDWKKEKKNLEIRY